MASKGRAGLLIIICLILIAGGAAVFVLPSFLGSPPEISLKSPSLYLGVETKLEIQIKNQGLGLKRVSARLEQGGKLITLADQQVAEGSKQGMQLNLTVKAKEMGLSQGRAKLVVKAQDASLVPWSKGKEAALEKELAVDTAPPRLGILNRIIHINRGGSALALYRINEEVKEHGVMVGQRRFKGFTPWPQRPHTGACFFAYDQAEKQGAAFLVWAKDPAGNQGQTSLRVRLHWKKYRHDDINLSDRFLKAIAPRFADRMPPSQDTPLKSFIYVNTKLRQDNDQKIYSLALPSSAKPLGLEVFKRPRGKPMAGFGDRRTYFYKGKEVSKAVHLGVDLADVAHSPIRAVSAGKVLNAGPVGIYGNCVILDHGLGVVSLYGHMSSLAVKPGDMVNKNQELGKSGATGLALGDHLHFSVLVNGVFVNPTEWWDRKWVKDNIEHHLNDAGTPPFKPEESSSKKGG